MYLEAAFSAGILLGDCSVHLFTESPNLATLSFFRTRLSPCWFSPDQIALTYSLTHSL